MPRKRIMGADHAEGMSRLSYVPSSQTSTMRARGSAVYRSAVGGTWFVKPCKGGARSWTLAG